MPDPSLTRVGDRLYFTDASGQRWRIHDASWRTGLRWQRWTPPARHATHRIFVAENGRTKRVTPIQADERGPLTVVMCCRQLERAEYLGEMRGLTQQPLDPRGGPLS